jgi:hypothetical protein
MRAGEVAEEVFAMAEKHAQLFQLAFAQQPESF